MTIEQNFSNAELEDFFTLLRKTGLYPDWFRGKRLLDIGCGHGRYSLAVAERGAISVDGIDINEPRIRFAQQKALELQMPHVRFHVASVYGLPFADETFDGAFSHTVFEHLPDLPAALQEIYRVLKPGAMLFVTHDSFRSRYGAHVQDLVHMPRPALFFSEPAIERVCKSRAEKLIRAAGADGNLLSFDDGLGGLNKLRISEVEKIMRGSRFKLIRVVAYAQEEHLLKWFPFLRKHIEIFEYLRG